MDLTGLAALLGLPLTAFVVVVRWAQSRRPLAQLQELGKVLKDGDLPESTRMHLGAISDDIALRYRSRYETRFAPRLLSFAPLVFLEGVLFFLLGSVPGTVRAIRSGQSAWDIFIDPGFNFSQYVEVWERISYVVGNIAIFVGMILMLLGAYAARDRAAARRKELTAPQAGTATGKNEEPPAQV